MSTREIQADGLDCLRIAVELLRRVRLAAPTGGIWDAADVQWWWRRPRPSDELAQTFVVDGDGPLACALATDWGENWQLDPIVVPGHDDALLRVVFDRGLALCEGAGARRIDTLVRDDDAQLRDVVQAAGFERLADGGTTGWVDAGRLAAPREFPPGYRMTDRASSPDGPHWNARRSGEEAESRLRQTPTYDPRLDLAVLTDEGEIAGYALLWFDPVTLVGMIEPMRTEDAHQRRGVGSALLGAGLRRLVDRGARRLKVGWVAEEAGALYQGLGFRPSSTDHAYSRTR